MKKTTKIKNPKIKNWFNWRSWTKFCCVLCYNSSCSSIFKLHNFFKSALNFLQYLLMWSFWLCVYASLCLLDLDVPWFLVLSPLSLEISRWSFDPLTSRSSLFLSTPKLLFILTQEMMPCTTSLNWRVSLPNMSIVLKCFKDEKRL